MKKSSILFELKEIDCLILRRTMGDAKKKNHPPLTPVQGKIIKYLLDSTEDVYQKDLENILKLRRSTISGILQTMEKNNIIKRIAVEADARIKKIVLTDIAIEKSKELKKRFKKIEEEITKNITEEELDIYLKVSNQIKNNLLEGMD